MEKLKVVVSLITEHNDFQRAQAASAQATAAKVGATATIIYANNDAVNQTQQLLRFIQDPSKRPDAIIVEPVGTGMRQVASAAVTAGIAWGVINARVDYLSELRQRAQVPVYSVVSDHEEVGRIQGQQIAAMLGEEGCVLYIEGPGIGDVARLRTKGMMATKPAKVTIKTLRGDWTQRSGYNTLRSWLALSTSRELHVGMVASQNDDMALGARHAFEEITSMQERDQWLRLPITGCDGVPDAGQTLVRQGRLAATIYCPPMTGDALQLLATSRLGGTQPEERTLIAPSSFPALAELKRRRSAAAGS
jgi:ribose transport system substrate-binding protein